MRPQYLIAENAEITARLSRNQKQLHKEARKPCRLSVEFWFPGFLIKKSSRNVTILTDSL